jgi:hypothetical protein
VSRPTSASGRTISGSESGVAERDAAPRMPGGPDIAGEIAQAFVRIRPDTHGFKAEAEGIKGGPADVARSLGGIFAVGGAIEGIKSLVEAATEHQAAFASARAGHAQRRRRDEPLRAVARAPAREGGAVKGFSDEQLAQSFLRPGGDARLGEGVQGPRARPGHLAGDRQGPRPSPRSRSRRRSRGRSRR